MQYEMGCPSIFFQSDKFIHKVIQQDNRPETTTIGLDKKTQKRTPIVITLFLLNRNIYIIDHGQLLQRASLQYWVHITYKFEDLLNLVLEFIIKDNILLICFNLSSKTSQSPKTSI